MIKDIMNLKEVAEYIGLSRSKIYQLIRQKKIPASRIGRQYKFSKQVVDDWLKAHDITRPEEVQLRLFERGEPKLKKGKVPSKIAMPEKKEVSKHGKEEESSQEKEEEKEVK